MAFLPRIVFPQAPERLNNSYWLNLRETGETSDEAAQLKALEEEHKNQLQGIAGQHSNALAIGQIERIGRGPGGESSEEEEEEEEEEEDEEEELEEDEEYDSGEAEDVDELEPDEFYTDRQSPVFNRRPDTGNL